VEKAKREAERVALAGYLFDAHSIALQIKDDGGLRPATKNELKGFREMVRMVFDDVAAVQAEAETTSGGWVSLPPGTHEVRIADAKEKRSRAGNDGLSVLLVDSEDRSVWDTVWITEKTRANQLQFAKAIGCELRDGVAVILTPEGVHGRRCSVIIIEEEYDGETRSRVKFGSWAAPSPANQNDPWPTMPTAAEVERITQDDIPF